MSERVDQSERVIHAPASAVFKALSTAPAWLQWLAPGNMVATIDEFNPVPGGRFHMTLTYLDEGAGKSSEHSDVVQGTFVELVPDSRVAYDAEFESDDPAFAGVMRMMWSVAAHDSGGCLVTFAATNVPPGVRPEDHQQGLSQSLANLARYLEAIR